ncbi:MAG: FlgD immunoglobulin-like domain containing protein, partial [Candidatus Eisenbacteria bacterium]
HVGAETDYAEYHLLAFMRPASSVLLPPGGLSATAANSSDNDDAVHLQWVNASAYDSVRVYRGGTLVTTLAGSSDQFDDAADRGLYRYEVSGVIEGTESSRAADDEFAGVLSCNTTDGFESGNANLWIREDSAPGSHWDVVPGFAEDGTYSFSDSPPGVPYRGSPAGGNVNAIAVFAVPTRLQGLSRLMFDQICITENDFDYGIVEISNDDGLSWNELARYDQGDDPGWLDNAADPTDWRPVDLDLAAYNGQEVLIRFRLQSDANLEFDGWYVDNVRVTGCAALAVIPDFAGSTAVTFAAQPAPNPVVSGTTLFQYAIGSDIAATGSVPVSFTLHDMMGRKIRTLVSEAQGVGRYRVQWNAADDDGRHVAPGVYYANLRAGKLTKSVKVAVIR